MATAREHNRIDLKANGHREEGIANAAISPGHIIRLRSDADDKVEKQATAGAACEKAIALHDRLQGKTVDDAYAADDVVFYLICAPGDVVVGRLAAAATAITKGGKLTVHSDGTVKTVGSDTPHFIALESVDNSAGGSEAFIRMRAL